MSRFLFTTMPATGHVMPKLPIARELVARGHEVHWYTGAVYREQVRATGAVHHPIRSAEDFGGQTIGEAFPELVGLTGIAMVRQAFQRVFIDNAEGMLRDCQAILAEHPADAILSEPLFVAARWLHELGGPPWATLGESAYGGYSRDAAPFGPGLFPMGGPLGQVRNRVMNAVHRRVLFAPVTAHYERARERVGLPRLGSASSTRSPVPTCTCSRLSPGSSTRGATSPATSNSSGRCRGDRGLPAARLVARARWGAPRRAQGTVATDPRHLLVPIEALADEPVLVIATTVGPAAEARDALGGAVPANARVEPFVPHAELMPHVDVIVTNGGYGTVQHALSRGVPIVVAGVTEDKPESAARIAWSGAGIRIREQSPAPERLGQAVQAVLGESRYRERAQAIAEEMRGYDAPRTAATMLEGLASSLSRRWPSRAPDASGWR